MFLSQAPDLAAQARALQEQKAEQEKEIADLKKQLENESKVKLSLSLSPLIPVNCTLDPCSVCLVSLLEASMLTENPTPITPLRSIIKLTNYWLIRKTGPKSKKRHQVSQTDNDFEGSVRLL